MLLYIEHFFTWQCFSHKWYPAELVILPMHVWPGLHGHGFIHVWTASLTHSVSTQTHGAALYSELRGKHGWKAKALKFSTGQKETSVDKWGTWYAMHASFIRSRWASYRVTRSGCAFYTPCLCASSFAPSSCTKVCHIHNWHVDLATGYRDTIMTICLFATSLPDHPPEMYYHLVRTPNVAWVSPYNICNPAALLDTEAPRNADLIIYLLLHIT